jgi:hypothetical protein
MDCSYLTHTEKRVQSGRRRDFPGYKCRDLIDTRSFYNTSRKTIDSKELAFESVFTPDSQRFL